MSGVAIEALQGDRNELRYAWEDSVIGNLITSFRYSVGYIVFNGILRS